MRKTERENFKVLILVWLGMFLFVYYLYWYSACIREQ